MNETALRQLLEGVSHGSVDVDDAITHLRDLPYENLGYARIDHHRALRKDAPEVVFCEGKTPEQAAEIFARIAAHAGRALGTRAREAHAEAIRARVPQAVYFPIARVVMAGVEQRRASGDSQPYALVASGGTADVPIAEEAALTMEFHGCLVKRLYDVGVAGVHRLMDQRQRLVNARVIVAIAGMDGALPGLIAGLVGCPVIAVPTSVGYGTGLGGVAALMNMLNACAPGVAVVNIDNGFGGGYFAAMIARTKP
ncbi:MAG TPA: nickel pincer cofactor biosynthesis protein LarB [Anaerolineae bacterium]|nr:nickel pincer cofactor biosynthesis protein LarB [Anaerolineae bacterium]